MKYTFKNISTCIMCGYNTSESKVLGLRLNQTQGLFPKRKMGVAISVVKCRKCDLIYSNPQPIPNDLQDHYGTPPEDYWKSAYFDTSNENGFASVVAIVKTLLKGKETIKSLDIGAGLGKAMKAMEDGGFDTFGLEPSVQFHQRAIENMKILPERLKLGAVENVEYESESFDFITFGAVLEHLYEPAFCINKAMNWLKPGGIIHIEVPNSNWLIAKVINKFYTFTGTNYVTNISPMHTPYHLYEFDLKSFEALSKKLNFKIVKYHYDVCDIFFVPKLFKPIFRLIMNWTNTGLQLTVYLEKSKNGG